MLMKKIAQVNRHAQTRKVATTSSTSQYVAPDEQGAVTLSVQKIVAVETDMLIREDGKKAQLFSMPGYYWKCTADIDAKGVSQLTEPITGLFIEDSNHCYCLGVTGATSEFEVRMHIGSNEVRLNNLFLNLNATHIAKNGVEEK